MSREPTRRWGRLAGGALVGAALFVAPSLRAAPDLVVDAQSFRIVARESGPVNYYSVVTEEGASFVRSRYLPPAKTAVVGWATPEADRSQARTLHWRWRALALPASGDECASGREDSAAVVYVSWRRGLRYYTLKYVWSAVGTKGSVCDRRRNPFVAQDTVIVESGGPLGAWRMVDLDLKAEFRNHFEGGDASASVPDFVGIGLMSDGDQTRSESSADFGGFVVGR